MEQKVSFTQVIKSELATCSFDENRLRAMLASFIKINGVLNIREQKTSIDLKTENADVAKLLHQAVKKVYGLSTKFVYQRAFNFKRRMHYHLVIKEGTDYLLSDLDISFLENKISKSIVNSDEMIGAYMAGAFLACGAVNSPHNSNYHLEFALNDLDYAKWFIKMIHRHHERDFDVKLIARRKKFVVYLKKSDQIVDCLILMGATDGALKFEDIRIGRDFSNIGNRLQNLDVANYQKTCKSAKKQLADIEVLESLRGSENIGNEREKILIKLRKENPDATLLELSNLMSMSLDKTLSKSTLSRMFNAIHLKAERYRRNEK